MIVDNLKSCYTTQMRVRLNPELIVTVRWYFAPPGAKPLPTPTAFDSSVWNTDFFDSLAGDLGETSLTRTWDAGVAPPGVTGQSTPTPLSWFLAGVPASVTGPYPNGMCPGETLLFSCVNCPKGALVTHTLYGEPFKNGLDPMGGVQTVNYVSSCTWEGPPRLLTLQRPAPDFTLVEFFNPFGIWPMKIAMMWRVTVRPNNVQVVLQPQAGGPAAIWQSAGPWDCQSPVVCTFQGGEFPKDGPPTILLDGGLDVPLIGSVAWDAGVDAVPAGYLLCDGSRVSQATYALLWGRIQFTYGPDLGDGTFPLPDLRDRCPVGSGNSYATGQTGGEAQHTLVAAEVPDVPIVITDPGHQHSPGVAGESFYTRLTTGTFAAIGGGSGASRDAFTNVASTGISADMPTALGHAHNNLQPYTALRPLIYAGV
jgi:microcystin-dependent protein